MLKKIFKSRGSKVWGVVSSLLIILMVIIPVLTLNTFAGFLNFALGGPRAVYADGTAAMYTATKSSNKTEAYQNANAMNELLCEEGMVLLLNENNALPLNKGARISVFGKNSVNLSYGNSGSSGGSLEGKVNLYAGLEAAGFVINPTLKAFYEDTRASGPVRSANSTDLDSGDTVVVSTAETPQNLYTDAVKASYADYKDAALVVITRTGGEGWDLPRTMKGATGYRNEDDHYLQLDQNETDLLAEVCAAGFDHVVVLFNIPSSMEAGFLTDPSYYAYQEKIDGAMYIGFPGKQGCNALGKILAGEVNPSGHLVDTWAADFKQNPTWNNFGDNRITGNTSKKIQSGDQYRYDDNLQQYFFVDYEEGIYMGYRYYETRGETDGEKWYQKAVVFPFGYGLSYTSFDWTIANRNALPSNFTKNDKVNVEVQVTNTGRVAGKDVVQLYATAPYTAGGIEKAHKVLVGFAKTKLLQPGESDTVTVSFSPYDVASYDYSDANGNGFKGYELEKGEYTLWIAGNAHDSSRPIRLNLAEDARFENDPVTGEQIASRYSDNADEMLNSDWQLGQYGNKVLSRTDWEGTWPQPPTDAERTATPALISALKDESPNNPTDFDSMEFPWFDEKVKMSFREFLPEQAPETPTSAAIVSYNDPRWESFLDQCNANEMIALLNQGGYHTVAMERVGVPATNEYDGPTGYVNFMNKNAVYDVAYYPCEPIIAATWNTDLVEEFGVIMGEEGIWGNESGDGMPYTGIWAPGANIHRSPFGGRCGEYFSEDGLLTGKMAAAEVRGLQSRGVFCSIKHFALNEQETHRAINGDISWVTEQAMREIYLKGFEIGVKEGEARAVMSSFNRIGTVWTGGDYRLLTEILRNEWGFRGLVVCDFNTNIYQNSRQMAYAGGDLNLATLPVDWCDPSDQADAIILRQNTKNILYTVVNSNAMSGEIIGYKPPMWHYMVIGVDVLLGLIVVAWGFFAIRKSLRMAKHQ